MSSRMQNDPTLPPYEVATSRDPIPLISPYIRLGDVRNCLLVSTSWHNALEEWLWGEPANYWALGERNTLVGFLKFIQVLPIASSKARSKVHTLSLEQVHATVYTDLPPTWLAQLLNLLPNLQNLAVTGFPFFDHGSLTALGQCATARRPVATYGNIRYLNASHLTNTTASSLTLLLGSILPNLEFLDLSYTNGANHPETLLAIGQKLVGLKSLKLRGLKLTDNSLELLCRSIEVRLKRLDVADNLLTDNAVETLLVYSFMPPDYAEGGDGLEGQSWPIEFGVLRGNEGDGDDDACFGFSEGWTTAVRANRRRANDSMARHIPPPDIEGRQLAPTESGIISLNIAGNNISVDGVISIIKSERLISLDCGVIKTTRGKDGIEASKILKVVPALERFAFKKLRHLRINYRIVCGVGNITQTTTLSGLTGYPGHDDEKGPNDLRSPSSQQHQQPLLSPSSPSFRLLTPSSLPKLKQLVLVDVPFQTSDRSVVANLLNFLNSIPPTPPHEVIARGGVLPACITFEFRVCSSGGDETEDLGMYGASSSSAGGYNDDDTSTFLEASMGDFSFFDEASQEEAAETRGDVGGSGGRWLSNTESKMAAAGPPGISGESGRNTQSANLGEINVAEKLKEWRLNRDGPQWRGAIKFVRDFGGRERSLDGEKWGLIVETL